MGGVSVSLAGSLGSMQRYAFTSSLFVNPSALTNFDIVTTASCAGKVLVITGFDVSIVATPTTSVALVTLFLYNSTETITDRVWAANLLRLLGTATEYHYQPMNSVDLNPPLIMKADNGLSGQLSYVATPSVQMNLNLRGLLIPSEVAAGLDMQASKTGATAW